MKRCRLRPAEKKEVNPMKKLLALLLCLMLVLPVLAVAEGATEITLWT